MSRPYDRGKRASRPQSQKGVRPAKFDDKFISSEGEGRAFAGAMVQPMNGDIVTMKHRIVKFATVGALGTLIDIGLFAVLHIVVGIPALAANTISYSAGIVNNFVLHRDWTFAERERKPTAEQFSQFAAVSLSALILNDLLVWIFSPEFGRLVADAGSGTLAAKLAATAVGMVWNFVANNSWTFGRRVDSRPATPDRREGEPV